MNLSMKIFTFLALVLALTVSSGSAETKYVSEDFEITMRTGPGADRKIIALVPSGREMEVITTGEEWTEVRLANGKEGWVLTRYLTDNIPTSLKLYRLEQNHAKVVSQYEALQEKASNLSSENKRLSADLGQTQDSLQSISTAHETLKSESTDFLKLKTKHDKSLKELKETHARLNTLESEFDRLAGSEITKGMIYGGGLLVFGFIVGYILKRPKRRAPLM